MKKTGAIIILLLTISVGVFASTGQKELRLHLQDSLNVLADETDIYMDVGNSPAYLPGEDTRKLFDTVASVPQIYSLTSDAVPCNSNVWGPFTQDVIIGIGIRVAGGSIYVFSAPLIDNFDPTTIILLEDRSTGVFHDMREGSYAVQINQAQNNPGRFYLHISYPPSVNIIPAGCNNNNGAISVVEDSTILWSSIQLFDSVNVYVRSYNNIKGNFNFAGLPEGSYNLAFVYGVYSAVKSVYINGSQIICNIGASSIKANVGQQITFNSNAQNANGYVWDFGDSTLITGVANVNYEFRKPGTYLVSVQCTNNSGCSAYAYVTVVVGGPTAISQVEANEVKIFTEGRNVVVHTGSTYAGLYEIYDLSGRVILAGPLDSSTSTISMSGEASGIYIVRLQSQDGNLTRKIFLE